MRSSLRTDGRVVTFRARSLLVDQVRAEAKRRGVSVSAVIRTWLHEGAQRAIADQEKKIRPLPQPDLPLFENRAMKENG